MHISAKPGALAAGALAVAIAIAGCGGSHRTPRSGALVTVPRVKDATIAKGEALVRRAGLVWSPMYAGSAGAPEIVTTDQIVLSQGPAAGKRVPRGTPVAVAIGVRPSTIAKVRRSRGH